MQTMILAQQLDETIIFTHSSVSSGYASPEPRRMRVVPPPWNRPWIPHHPPYGYVIPPRFRRQQHNNARWPVAGEAASYNYEMLEQQNLQREEIQDRKYASGLSKECIFQYLIGCLDCSREGEETCTICQDKIQMEETMATLSCNHVYHLSCIKKWLKIKNECAVCRALVIPINGEGLF